MNKEKIVIIGGGGHANVLVGVINQCKNFEIIGIIDPNLPINSLVLGYPVLGGDQLLEKVYQDGVRKVVIGIGGSRDTKIRKFLYKRVKQIGFTVPILRHPASIVADNVLLAEGVQIMAGVIIQTGSSIGENTIINTGAQIDHDCKVGKHVHIAPGVVFSGGVIVGDEVFVGVGSVAIQEVKIGNGVLVAAGAVIIRDVAEGATVKGVPAK